MQKWEYLAVFVKDSDVSDDKEIDVHLDADTFTEKLNRYGQAGWELVSFTWPDDGGGKAVFKRPAKA
jgi:hypothetical protein